MKLYVNMLRDKNGNPPKPFSQVLNSTIAENKSDLKQKRKVWYIKKQFRDEVMSYLKTFSGSIHLMVFPEGWKEFEIPESKKSYVNPAPYLSNSRGYGNNVIVKRTEEMEKCIENRSGLISKE